MYTTTEVKPGTLIEDETGGMWVTLKPVSFLYEMNHWMVQNGLNSETYVQADFLNHLLNAGIIIKVEA